MTLADLDRKTRALQRLLDAQSAPILARVDRLLEDAHAHATKAITDTLKATANGRPTVRKANRSPSYQAAIGRLGEIWTWLAGPTTTSLDGKIRDAREAFYREAFTLGRKLVPAELHVSPDPEPTQQNIRLVRGALIHGLDLRRELEGPIQLAARRLAAAVALAGQREATQATEADLLGHWHRQSRDAIRATVARCLSDSLEFADNEAMVDLIHPDHLEPAQAGA